MESHQQQTPCQFIIFSIGIQSNNYAYIYITFYISCKQKILFHFFCCTIIVAFLPVKLIASICCKMNYTSKLHQTICVKIDVIHFVSHKTFSKNQFICGLNRIVLTVVFLDVRTCGKVIETSFFMVVQVVGI